MPLRANVTPSIVSTKNDLSAIHELARSLQPFEYASERLRASVTKGGAAKIERLDAQIRCIALLARPRLGVGAFCTLDHKSVPGLPVPPRNRSEPDRTTIPRFASNTLGTGLALYTGVNFQTRCSVLLLALAVSNVAFAEGSDQTNTTQALRSNVQMYVDIVDTATESIRWIGVGDVQITNPTGTVIATLSSGDTASLVGEANGAFGVRTLQGQVVGIRWDVEVLGAASSSGRLHSYNWGFNAGSFASDRSTYCSFYALVPGGAAGTNSVIELKLDGLAGYVYNINANSTGVDGPDAGRSVSMYGHTLTPEFPMYLAPPASASYNAAVAEVYGLDYIGGVSEDIDGDPVDSCDLIAPGASFGRFQFYTPVSGTYHLQCDLDGDGVFETTNNDDFLRVGAASPGVNTVLWDGIHQGSNVALGTYNCRVRLTVGEFHYVGSDIETSYEGLRLYAVQADGSRVPLAMRWNDSDVQASAQNMPNGEPGLENPGEAGLDSGAYTDPADANVNARAWGAFNSGGKGNQNYLDTYVWLSEMVSSEITLTAVDPTVDTDGDGVSDYAERCVCGTDPALTDTDGDGTTDDLECPDGTSSGGVGGLESNGRMASQLASRSIMRSRMSDFLGSRVLGNISPLTDTNEPIWNALHALEAPGLARVESTPADLPGLTNAVDVMALDFVDEDGAVAGSALLIETSGELYEHSKGICDRAGGAEITEVGESRGLLFATFVDHEQGTSDHATSFTLYQQADGRFEMQQRWLAGAYRQPTEAERVVQVQVWANDANLTRTLTDRLLAQLNAQEAMAPQIDATLDEATFENWEPAMAVNSTPNVLISRASLLGSQLDLDLLRVAGGSSSEVRIRVRALDELGNDLEPSWVELSEVESSLAHLADVGRVREVYLDVFEGERLVDEVWLSDGAWAAFHDGLWGGETNATFTGAREDGCALHSYSETGREGVELHGCGRIDAANVDQYAGVARHLSRRLSAADFSGTAFHYQSDSRVEVCVEDTHSGDRACRTLAAAGQGAWASVGTELPSGRFNLITFTRGGAGTLEVSGMAMTRIDPGLGELSSCSAGGSIPSGTGFALLLLGLVIRRRRD